jgi:hypothetical protein
MRCRRFRHAAAQRFVLRQTLRFAIYARCCRLFFADVFLTPLQIALITRRSADASLRDISPCLSPPLAAAFRFSFLRYAAAAISDAEIISLSPRYDFILPFSLLSLSPWPDCRFHSIFTPFSLTLSRHDGIFIPLLAGYASSFRFLPIFTLSFR